MTNKRKNITIINKKVLVGLLSLNFFLHSSVSVILEQGDFMFFFLLLSNFYFTPYRNLSEEKQYRGNEIVNILLY